ncbi:MAG: hypothetical protein DRJ60_00080 [Thermoprotei archaeon]|nr:MAG: hypothetical protein DRJ60_00080 [Thermoprotei archaeon]
MSEGAIVEFLQHEAEIVIQLRKLHTAVSALWIPLTVFREQNKTIITLLNQILDELKAIRTSLEEREK